MKVTYQWLKDFVKVGVAAEALAHKLTMAGLTVEGFEAAGDDFVYDIEITSNRPDWLSVAGIAREVAAVTGAPLVAPAKFKPRAAKKRSAHEFTLQVEDPKDCPLYTGRLIRGVRIGPSPEWLKQRIERVGVRSINNVVDITNYVLFEMGAPLHAFDFDALCGRTIRVRRARAGEKLATIDAQVRELTPDLLVIADGEKPVALAGVMGGKDTEVGERTVNVLLEAAVFSPLLIRRSRQKFGLQTDSSYRFERGVPLETAQAAAARAAELILQLAGGTLEDIQAKGAVKSAGRSLRLDAGKVSRFLGQQISSSEISRCLRPLGFSVKALPGKAFSVAVPHFRPDVKLPVDLIEEVARVYGYVNFPSTLATVPPRPQGYTLRDFTRFGKQLLTGLGVHEAVTLSLVPGELLEKAGYPKEAAVRIVNPLSREQELMRPSLIPSLLQSVRINFNRQQPYVALFEAAHTFTVGPDGMPRERECLGIVLAGVKTVLLPGGQVRDQWGLLHLKGIVEELLSRLGIKGIAFVPRGQGFMVTAASGEELGTMQLVSRKVCDAMDIKHKDVAAAELFLDTAFRLRVPSVKYARPPQFPAIARDISFYVPETVTASQLLELVREAKAADLEEAKVTDRYRGAQVPAGHQGLVISCVYRAASRTLSDAQVQPQHDQLCRLLQERFGAVMR
jgi:phenylalanyl-tRNA synthetase beta chain